MFWVSGSLPTATKTQSKLSLSPSEKLTFLSVIDSTDVSNLKFTPHQNTLKNLVYQKV
jgi:hypothetical protein